MISLSSPTDPSILNVATGVIPQPNITVPSSPDGGGGGGGGVAGTLAQEGVSSAPTGAKQPSWWEKLLPTAGGVLGGILGGAADVASLGALAPLINPVTGAALGGAAGQMGENAMTGKKVLEGNDVSSGVENGVGSLIGGEIAKGVGMAGKGVVGALGNVVGEREGQAATDAAAAAKNAEIQRLGDEFKPHVNDPTVTPKTGQVTSQLYALGYDKPMAQDAVNVGNVITGSNDNGAGIINQVKQDILQKAGGNVNIGQIGDASTPSGKLLEALRDPTTQSELGDPLDQSGKSVASAILSKYNLLANGAGVPTEGAGNITPTSGFKLLSDVSAVARKAAANAGKLNASNADSAQAAIWTGLKNNLKDALYNRPEVNGEVSAFRTTPELESQIDKKIAAEGIDDPKVAANLKTHIVNTLNQSGTMQDLLDAENEGVSMSKVGQSALKQQGNISSAASQRLAKNEAEPDMVPAKGGKGKGMVDLASIGLAAPTHGLSLIGLAPHAIQLAKSPAAQEAAYNVLSKATSSDVATKMIPTLMRTGTIAAANLPNIAAESQSAIPLSGGQSQDSQMLPTNTTAVNPYSAEYSALINQMQSPTGLAGDSLSALNSILPTIQKQQLAANALSALPSAYANAGGAQGPAGGLLNSIIGHLVPGSAQNTFQRQSLATAAQLAAATGMPLAQAQMLLTQMQQTPLAAQTSQTNEQSLLNMLTPQMTPAQ